jgi:hypothetical protein
VTFPMSQWIGPLRRRMVRTMSGLDRGVIRSPIALPELAQWTKTLNPVLGDGLDTGRK